MNNNEWKTRTRERQQTKTAEASKTQQASADDVCPHCGAAVLSEYEICPECGWKLVSYCTFCGAPMNKDDMDCQECGMPADGVMCPDCRVINFRSFCRKCGKPLTRAARVSVERARQDPKVQEAARLLQKIAELRTELESSSEAPTEEEPQGPTEGELRLKELMAKVGIMQTEIPKPQKRKIGRSRETILTEIRKTVGDANKVLEEMLPPVGTTPQQQRNYYTTRKVAVVEIVEERWFGIPVGDAMLWLCNRCQVYHDNPSQCSFPDSGGQWVEGTEFNIVDEGTKGAIENIKRVEKIVYKRE